jgi:hypothetical protein
VNIEVTFREKDAKRVWDQYIRRIQRILKPLDPDMREEISLEIQGHLLESLHDGEGATEIERLLDATERLGEPEEYLRQLMADRLLAKGTRTLHPVVVARGLFFSLFGGMWRVLLTIVTGLGFLASFALAVLALLKPVFPRHIGLLLLDGGGIVLGAASDPSHVKSDALGYWFVPLGLAAAFFLYVVFVQLLRVLRRMSARSPQQ